MTGGQRRRALERIVQCSSFWTSRESVTEHSIVVEDDGRHYNVRVLDRAGKIAHAALAALQSVPDGGQDAHVPIDPEAEQDFVEIILQLTNFVQNERVRAYNEGVDTAAPPPDGSPPQEDAITRLRRLLKLCKAYIHATALRAMIDAELARGPDPAPGKIEPRIVEGPPCPTCGFRIREVPRQPFSFDDLRHVAGAIGNVTDGTGSTQHTGGEGG